MTVIEKVKNLIIEGMKVKSPTVRILRVVLGEFQRGMKEPSDENCYKIIKKLIESNKEILKTREDSNLIQENNTLELLLPQEITIDEIYKELSKVVVQIQESKSDGQAIGIAMKCLKETGLLIDSKKVSEIVLKLKYY